MIIDSIFLYIVPTIFQTGINPNLKNNLWDL